VADLGGIEKGLATAEETCSDASPRSLDGRRLPRKPRILEATGFIELTSEVTARTGDVGGSGA